MAYALAENLRPYPFEDLYLDPKDKERRFQQSIETEVKILQERVDHVTVVVEAT